MLSERAKAKDAGETTYFTGRPCVHGHIAMRQTSSGVCISCRDIRSKTDERKEKSKEYVAKNRESINKNSKKYREANKGKINALTAFRYTAKLQRTLSWLTEEEKQRIKCYYSLAAMRNRTDDKTWDVDHIVPLRGTGVSGLHVPWNLQVIPRIDNIKKGNKFVV